jgi:hypothetical protein
MGIVNRGRVLIDLVPPRVYGRGGSVCLYPECTAICPTVGPQPQNCGGWREEILSEQVVRGLPSIFFSGRNPREALKGGRLKRGHHNNRFVLWPGFGRTQAGPSQQPFPFVVQMAELR